MIYAAFSVWLFLILFVGIGIYRLWTGLVKPAWVNWTLLPGTVVSEMAYIFGCLITGGTVKHAKLIDTPGEGKKGGGEAKTEASPGLKGFGPVVASLLAIVACGAAILLVHSLLGKPVLDQFNATRGFLESSGVPKELPDSWDAFWAQIGGQVSLLQRTLETWGQVQWSDWHVPLFVYLSICLAIRLAPVGRPVRPTLAAVVLIAVLIGLVGLTWKRFSDLMNDLWPLVNYVWATLLMLLVLTLVLYGVLALIAVLSGKGDKG